LNGAPGEHFGSPAILETYVWIQECHRLYGEFVERSSGGRVVPGRLEEALSEAKAKRKIGTEELRLIEDSPDWPYPQWWPRLSAEFGDPVLLPQDEARTVQILQDRIKYIEVVSVALRFIFPEDYGIMSPPVIGLLNLSPGGDHTGHYLRYLAVLKHIRQHYEGLGRIADVDMALWVAAHLDSTEYSAILEALHQDQTFQEIRLRNMVDSLGRYWGRNERARLTLAQVLAKHDHVLAALIAARCFESKVIEMAARLKINADTRYMNEGVLHALVRKLELQRVPVPEGVSLDDLRQHRNYAVHKFDPSVSKAEASHLIAGVGRLYEE